MPTAILASVSLGAAAASASSAFSVSVDTMLFLDGVQMEVVRRDLKDDMVLYAKQNEAGAIAQLQSHVLIIQLNRALVTDSCQ